jgi:MoaD family protein
MRIKVQFFSQLRELAGAGDDAIELADGSTAQDLLSQLYQRHPALEKWDRNLLLGVGVEFVARDYRLQPGDQVAIMPPVQGG